MNRPLRHITIIITAVFLVMMGVTTYIQAFQAPSLNADSRNVRTIYHEYGTNRGPIIVSGNAIASSTPSTGNYKYQRVYTDSPLYSNLTGYFATSFTSMSGIEKAKNSVLGGSDSSLFFQRTQQMLQGSDPVGGGVELTIDADLQKVAAQALGDQKGAIVALNPRTGAILAQVTSPSYDANQLATHDRQAASAAWKALSENVDKPLVDRATGGDQYPPGSVFKMLTVSAMLENNSELNPQSAVQAPTSWTLPGSNHTIYNPGKAVCGDGSGQVTLTQAFIQSCNTPFAIAGTELGANKMRDMAKAFGFGTTFKTPLAVTASRFPEPESDAALAMDSFGQQDVRVTPMQIALIASAIANDGTLMEPYLVKRTLTSDLETVTETEPKVFSQPISKQTAQYLTEMMEADVSQAGGTGAKAAIEGVQVAGKTGTAETGTEAKAHAWFASFAPAEDPSIVVVVFLENRGSSGGSAAAPLAREVIKEALGK